MSGRGMLVVGGSYAAAQAVASARHSGYGAPIRLLSEEHEPPYQRPPLSKGLLLGTFDMRQLPLRSEQFYRESACEVSLGTRVSSIDRGAQEVVTANGERIGYDRLLLATGARPRLLSIPGANLDGVMVLRTLADAVALRERLSEVETAVIIGGGYIGLEVASVLIALGKRVTVIEAQSRLLFRSTPPPLADFIADYHRKKGVRLVLDTVPHAITGEGGRARAVTVADGTSYPADLVVVAIGVLPNVELAVASGLPCDNGITVDRYARTADPLIFAAGDCTCHPNAYAETPVRLESVQNALDQARAAGASIAGVDKAYDAVPWFWSDQYELKLQMVGLAHGHDAYAIRGSTVENRFSIFDFKGDRLIGLDSVNRAGDHMVGRKLVAAQCRLTPAQAADESFDLRAPSLLGALDLSSLPRT